MQLVIDIFEVNRSNVRSIQAVAAHICNLIDIAICKETELYVQIKYKLVNKYDGVR